MVTQAHISDSTPLGAHLIAGGATFRLWAPRAQAVYLLTPSNSWKPVPADALQRRPSGDWAGFSPGFKAGDVYKFWVVGPGTSPDQGFKRDPYARDLTALPAFPDSHCVLRNPRSFPWRTPKFHRPDFSDLVIYQFHIGTFSIAPGNFNGKFLDVVDRIPYLHALGINAIEPLPVVEFPTEFSMGYNGTDYFSPEMDYAETDAPQLASYLARVNALLADRGLQGYTLADLQSPSDQLKAMIDVAHAYGISVILDVVYNHAGGGFDDASLWFLDRLPKGNHNDSLYFTDQGWAGGLVFAFWNDRVRELLQRNAEFYLDEYRVDGFRMDEVSVMDRFGGWATCQQLTRSLRQREPGAVLVAEYWPVNEYTVKSIHEGGAGFDAAWHDGLREAVRSALAQASLGAHTHIDLSRVAASLYPDRMPDPWRGVTCIENHDIVKGDHPRIARLADGSNPRSWYARSRARVANGILLTAPGIPLLFMGQEFLEEKSWSDNPRSPGLDWEGLLTGDRNRVDFLRFMQDLIGLRRRQPALRSAGLNPFHADNPGRILAYHRWVPGVGRDVIVVASLRELHTYDYRLGFPSEGGWIEVFNSDVYEHWVNPSVAGNGGRVHATLIPWQGLPASACVTLPANSLLVFARDFGDEPV